MLSPHQQVSNVETERFVSKHRQGVRFAEAPEGNQDKMLEALGKQI